MATCGVTSMIGTAHATREGGSEWLKARFKDFDAGDGHGCQFNVRRLAASRNKTIQR